MATWGGGFYCFTHIRIHGQVFERWPCPGTTTVDKGQHLGRNRDAADASRASSMGHEDPII